GLNHAWGSAEEPLASPDGQFPNRKRVGRMGNIVIRYGPYFVRVPALRQDPERPRSIAVQVDGLGPGVVEIKPQIVAHPLAHRPLHGVVVPAAVGSIGVISSNLLVEHGEGTEPAARGSAIDVDVIGNGAGVDVICAKLVVDGQ